MNGSGIGYIVGCRGEAGSQRPLLLGADLAYLRWLDPEMAEEAGWGEGSGAVSVEYVIDGDETVVGPTGDAGPSLRVWRCPPDGGKNFLADRKGKVSLQEVPDTPRTEVLRGFLRLPGANESHAMPYAISAWIGVLELTPYDIVAVDETPIPLGVLLPSATDDDLQGFADGLAQRLATSAPVTPTAEIRPRKDAPETALNEYAEQQMRTDVFINPYNFVSLPTSTPRTEPPTHLQLQEGRFAGRIEVEWVAQTPLLFGVGDNSALEPEGDNRYRVSGSSLKGALRSLHEALTGSCMRVFDDEFIPVYREPANADPSRQMAIVTAVNGRGEPTEVALCSETVWLKTDVLLSDPKHGAPALTTGDVVTIDTDGRPYEQRHGRSCVRQGRVTYSGVSLQPSTTRPDLAPAIDKFVILISDGGARDTRHDTYTAAGKVSNRRIPVAEAAADLWQREVEGSRDLSTSQRQSGNRRTKIEVKYGQQRIGSRWSMPTTPQLGDVIWVDVKDNTAMRMASSFLWRKTGHTSAADRLPSASSLACGHPRHGGDTRLCPSCQLFGSAGADSTAKQGRQASTQGSYRGHVRVSHLDVVTNGALVTHRLPPRGQPRPGAGQFYLQTTNEDAVETDNRNLPVAAWGSRTEGTSTRRIRGRKFYWHGEAVAVGGWRRDTARAHQDAREGMGPTTAELVPKGSTVRATVWFDNLTAADVGALLGTIDPTAVIDHLRAPVWFREPGSTTERSARLWTHLGGGKPLGLGSVEVTQCRLIVESPDRYSGVAAQEQTTEQTSAYASAFLQWVSAHVEDGGKSLKELASLLDPQRANPARIAYPPKGEWSQLDGTAKPMEEFDKSFEFFTQTAGRPKREAEPITPLPTATNREIVLPTARARR